MSNRKLVLDIETVPLASALNADYPADDRQPPANYKSDEAIAKWRAIDAKKWEAERVKECSLNPRLGRILCIGLAADDQAEPSVLMAWGENDEATVLEAFWNVVAQYDGRVVTWNGSWDLQFILLRSMANGVKPSISPYIIRGWFRKYAVEPHFDCKAALTNWGAPKAGEGLTQWATFLGIIGKTDGVSGANVYEMYQAKQVGAICEYCEQDVRATREVYNKIAAYFLDWPDGYESQFGSLDVGLSDNPMGESDGD